MAEQTAYSTERLDHLGIVAGICREIELIEQVDTLVGENDRKVSVGQAVQEMVLNGLGFVSRPLYLAPEFLAGKPVDILIGKGLTAKDFNDDSLGRALDRLYEVGVTEVFAYVVAHAVAVMGINTDMVHLDSTSFSLEGEYELVEPDDQAIRVTHGYSRDHRPDLKQVVLSLICSHQSGIPTWLAALDGNAADSSQFPQTVQTYVAQFQEGEDVPVIVADTALYNANTVKELEGVSWVTRVPASVSEVKDLYQTVSPEQMRSIGDGDYKVWTVESDYGEVAQRWVLVYSEGLYHREAARLQRVIDKERAEAEKVLRRLNRREYPTLEAAQAAVETMAESWKFHTVQIEPRSKPKYRQRGRPHTEQPPDYHVWQPGAFLCEDSEAIDHAMRTKGKFVIATNVLDTQRLSDEALIDTYKDQNTTVERGFRFLKDPLFFAHSLFLKKPERIMALLMVMGLCLLVYALAEHRLRAELVSRDETLPDQTGKPTQRLTIRRVFQVFEGIDILLLTTDERQQRLILNLTELHQRILGLLGWYVQQCYGQVEQEMPVAP
jgi:transposase